MSRLIIRSTKKFNRVSGHVIVDDDYRGKIADGDISIDTLQAGLHTVQIVGCRKLQIFIAESEDVSVTCSPWRLMNGGADWLVFALGYCLLRFFLDFFITVKCYPLFHELVSDFINVVLYVAAFGIGQFYGLCRIKIERHPLVNR